MGVPGCRLEEAIRTGSGPNDQLKRGDTVKPTQTLHKGSTSTHWGRSFKTEGAKSFVKSWSNLMSVIDSKSTVLKRAG
jgi:hypothetical protein